MRRIKIRVVYDSNRYAPGFADTSYIKLRWDTVRYASGYQIFASRSGDVSIDNYDTLALMSSSSDTTLNFVPSEFAASKDSISEYNFVIRAYRQGSPDSVFSAVSSAIDGAVRSLSAQNLQATNSTFQDKIRLTWNLPRYGNSDILGYQIYRSTDGGSFENIANVNEDELVDDTIFDDDYELKRGSVYYYKLKTVYGGGKAVSIFSDTSSFGALPLDPVNLRVTKNLLQVQVKFDTVAGATNFMLYRKENSSDFAGASVYIDLRKGDAPLDQDGDTLFYVDTGAVDGHLYFYKLRAYKEVGLDTIFSIAETDYGYQKLTLDSIDIQVDSGGIGISWLKEVNLGTVEPTEYDLYKRTQGGNWTIFDITNIAKREAAAGGDTLFSYLDEDVVKGGYYYYMLKAKLAREDVVIEFSSDEIGQMYGFEFETTLDSFSASKGTSNDEITVRWQKIKVSSWAEDYDLKERLLEKAPDTVSAYIIARENIQEGTVEYDTVVPSGLSPAVEAGDTIYTYTDDGSGMTPPVQGYLYKYSIMGMVQINNSPDKFYSPTISNDAKGTGFLDNSSTVFGAIYYHYDENNGNIDGFEITWGDNGTTPEGFIIEKATNATFDDNYEVDTIDLSSALKGILFTDSSFIDYQSTENAGDLGTLEIGRKYFYRLTQVNSFKYGSYSFRSGHDSKVYKYDNDTVFIYNVQDYNYIADGVTAGRFDDNDVFKLMDDLYFEDVPLKPAGSFNSHFAGSNKQIRFSSFDVSGNSLSSLAMFAEADGCLVDSLTVIVDGDGTEFAIATNLAVLAGVSQNSRYENVKIVLNNVNWNSTGDAGTAVAGAVAKSENDTLINIDVSGSSVTFSKTISSGYAAGVVGYTKGLYAKDIKVSFIDELNSVSNLVGGVVGYANGGSVVLENIEVSNIKKLEAKYIGSVVGSMLSVDSLSLKNVTVSNIESLEQSLGGSTVGYVVGNLDITKACSIENISVSGIGQVNISSTPLRMGAFGYGNFSGDLQIKDVNIVLPKETQLPSTNNTNYIGGVFGRLSGSIQVDFDNVVVDGNDEGGFSGNNLFNYYVGGLVGKFEASKANVNSVEVKNLNIDVSNTNIYEFKKAWVGLLFGQVPTVNIGSVNIEGCDIKVATKNPESGPDKYVGGLVGQVITRADFDENSNVSLGLSLTSSGENENTGIGPVGITAIGGLFGEAKVIAGLQADKVALDLQKLTIDEDNEPSTKTYFGLVAGKCDSWEKGDMHSSIWGNAQIDESNLQIDANNLYAGLLFGSLTLAESDTFVVENVEKFDVGINTRASAGCYIGLMAGEMSADDDDFFAVAKLENCDGATVKISENGYVSTGTYLGGLIGLMNNGKLVRSSVEGLVFSGSRNLKLVEGFLVGSLISDATIEECYAYNCFAERGSYLGMLVGKAQGGLVAKSYALQNKCNDFYKVGLFVGDAEGLPDATIAYCYSLENGDYEFSGVGGSQSYTSCGSLASVLMSGNIKSTTGYQMTDLTGYPSLVNNPQANMPQDNGLEMETGLFGSAYRITTPLQLDAIGDRRLANLVGGQENLPEWLQLDAEYELAVDLDFSDYSVDYTPIGYQGTETNFTGEFDGNGKRISNLVIEADDYGTTTSLYSNRGLFGVALLHLSSPNHEYCRLSPHQTSHGNLW